VAQASSGTTTRGGRAGGLPTGTVAFLFTDIEGSTRLARSLPDAFPGLLERHREILRGAFAAGIEVDSAGDAFFVAFAEVAEAVRAAAEVQRRLAAEPWPEGGRVRVRIGLHVGAAEVVGRSYVGAEVHRAARVCAAAHGGQVLVSQAAASLVQSAGVSVRPLGDYWLKDFDPAPEALHQLVAEGLGESFPPPRTAEARVVSLPREQTSFVGRERELAELLEIAIDSRLVTLTGEGGSGKSRLAVRIARDLAPRFRGPVVFVALARAHDVDEAVQALAGALQLDGMIGSWDEAAEVLESQNGLIVWDNAEHLPGLADRLAMLRDRCGRLHALVTSRRSLSVEGEQLYPVEPLDGDAAVGLLVDRARLLQPRFDVAAAEPKLREVARRLDGLPLALELAAARLRSLPVDALLDRLDRQLEVLADAGRVDRHKTMRGALQWSYDLVEPADRELFAAISVFAGPARLEAIAQVAGSDEVAALDGLTRLIDASLVRLQDSPEPRYWMLEPVRQFAFDLVECDSAATELRRRMLEWYVSVASALEGDTFGILTTFRRERENLLRAYDYAAQLGQWERGIDLAYRAAGAFYVGGESAAMAQWLRLAEAVEDTLSARARAQLALIGAWRVESDLDHTRLELSLARETADSRLLAEALQNVAFAAIHAGELDLADAILEELATYLGVTHMVAVNLPLNRAHLAEIRHDREAAEVFWAQAEAAARATGDKTDLVRCLWYAAGAALAHGEHARAHRWLEEAISADETWEAYAGTELAVRYSAGVAAALVGERLVAAAHLQRALLIYDRVGKVDRLIELPLVLLSAAVVLAGSGYVDDCARLRAHAASDIAVPSFDTFALARQLELTGEVGEATGDRLDRDQAMRLALDGMASVLERQTAA
jgi:predicted ATPase/class 3 adenylate cyclase